MPEALQEAVTRDSYFERLRQRQARVRHRWEQYFASARWSAPATHFFPHTAQVRCDSALRSAVIFDRLLRSHRQWRLRHAAEQYCASARTSSPNGFAQPRQ